MRTMVEAGTVSRVCVICGGVSQNRVAVDVDAQHALKPEKPTLLSGRHEIFICNLCGFLHNPDNRTKALHEHDLHATRIGTAEKPGREYAYADVGLKFLPKEASKTVLIFGAGASVDHRHIASLPGVSRVVVGDLHDYSGAENFVDITQPHPDLKADLLIASEVIEHFEEPVAHFQSMMELVADNGLAIMGTNFTGGMPVTRLTYPFIDGHVCMWSEGSIHRMAERTGGMATIFLSTVGGVRKRAIGVTRSPSIDRKLKRHFEKKKFLI